MNIHEEHNTSNLGFSLAEMLVVISIFSVMASVLMFNFRDFDSAIKLDNLTTRIALYIHQAQTTGSAGSQAKNQTENEDVTAIKLDEFDPSSDSTAKEQMVGVFFERIGSVTTGNFGQTIILFRDGAKTAGNTIGFYDSNRDVILEKATVADSHVIQSMCPITTTGCTPVTKSFSIAFKRPNPDPIVTLEGNNTINEAIAIQVLDSDTGKSQYIIVEQTGYIHIESALP